MPVNSITNDTENRTNLYTGIGAAAAGAAGAAGAGILWRQGRLNLLMIWFLEMLMSLTKP